MLRCAPSSVLRATLQRSAAAAASPLLTTRSACRNCTDAFKCAFARVHIMCKQYVVPVGEYESQKARGYTTCTKGSYTSNARLNYADGACSPSILTHPLALEVAVASHHASANTLS